MPRDLDNFRVLVVLALSTLVVAHLISYRAPPPPDYLQHLYEWRGYGRAVPGVLAWYWSWIETACYALALLGMFFFQRWSRLLMVIALFSSPLYRALGGIWVSSPVEDAFGSLHWIFVLFAVGMAFFSPPVRAAFQSPALVRQDRRDVDADA